MSTSFTSQLQMLRPNLENLPALNLPTGLAVRPASPDDNEKLAAMLAIAFQDSGWTPERVARELTDACDVDSTWILELDGQMAATCSCQNRNRGGTRGTLHWVGADPQVSGRKLGYWVCLAALHAFAETGYVDCDLGTDDPRLAAIKTYLDLGFEPVMVHEDHPARWNSILVQLKMA